MAAPGIRFSLPATARNMNLPIKVVPYRSGHSSRFVMWAKSGDRGRGEPLHRSFPARHTAQGGGGGVQVVVWKGEGGKGVRVRRSGKREGWEGEEGGEGE